MSSKFWHRLTIGWLLLSVVLGAVMTAWIIYEAYKCQQVVEPVNILDNVRSKRWVDL